jgi:hypothetical protein
MELILDLVLEFARVSQSAGMPRNFPKAGRRIRPPRQPLYAGPSPAMIPVRFDAIQITKITTLAVKI